MESILRKVENAALKKQVVDVKSGDTVRVHQKIKEGNKERVQIFEGLVIRTSKKQSVGSTITVRRISSGIGVEKTYLLHSPLVTKVEVTKRSKVRRNYLSYMRALKGKSARLSGVDFDKRAVNTVHDAEAEKAEAELKAKAEAEHAAKEAEEAAAKAAEEAKFEEAVKAHDA
ncbi:50S ribosomal protein L19 [Candidatus Saccharibacteria bacterium]|jgi:large subunit ribosomal protein L19|nr:MAG: 50S ribosomal protein L19 [Candidatus Saccharibacteria bacterium]